MLSVRHVSEEPRWKARFPGLQYMEGNKTHPMIPYTFELTRVPLHPLQRSLECREGFRFTYDMWRKAMLSNNGVRVLKGLQFGMLDEDNDGEVSLADITRAVFRRAGSRDLQRIRRFLEVLVGEATACSTAYHCFGSLQSGRALVFCQATDTRQFTDV